MFQSPNRLVVHVDTAAGLRYQGAVTDADVEGRTARIVAEFPLRSGPGLTIGEGVSLSFPGLRPGEPFHTPAQVITRIEDRLRIRYRFEVGRSVAAVLSPLADWRFATRVQPFPQAPILASIERMDQTARYAAEVRDISATGVALCVSAADEAQLFSAWKLRVTLRIPGASKEFELIGNICYRRPEKDVILYGIDFDHGATNDFNDKQKYIDDYVTGCQAAAIQMLRSALEKRKAG